MAPHVPQWKLEEAQAARNQKWYHQMSSDNLCYQTHYNDAHMGYMAGSCPFDKLLGKTTVRICKGHSEENTKYCQDSIVDVTVYKMGKDGAATEMLASMASSSWYHQMSSDNLCYQTHYNDAHYESMGYKAGSCPFDKLLNKTTVRVCKGHSEENTKYCQDSIVDVTVYKMGKDGAATELLASMASSSWYHQMSSDN